MMGNRVKDRGRWLVLSERLRNKAMKVYQVAQTKNVDGMLEVGGELTEACDACHVPYRDKPRAVASKH